MLGEERLKREVTKLKNTYVDVMPKMVDENSRLHTIYATPAKKPESSAISLSGAPGWIAGSYGAQSTLSG